MLALVGAALWFWLRPTLGVTAQRAAFFRAQAALAAAEAEVARARANRTLAHAYAERWRKLAATGDVSQMDLEARLTAAQSADEELKSAEAQRESVAKEVAAQKAAVDISQHDIMAASASLAATEARKAEAVITSPIDGYVVSRELEPGRQSIPARRSSSSLTRARPG